MRRTKKRNAPQGKIERKEKDAKGLVPVRIKRHRDKNGGHNHIIVEDIDNKHVSVGLTTRKTKGKNSNRRNYQCEVNPLGGEETSYLRTQGTVARKQEYDKQEKKGAMAPKDYEKAQEYAGKAKRKYLEQKK